MVSLDLLAVASAIGSVFYGLCAWNAFRLRRVQPKPALALLMYCALAFLWSGWQVAGRFGWLNALQPEFVNHLAFYGLGLLAISFFALTYEYYHAQTAAPTAAHRMSRFMWTLLALFWLAGTVLLDANFLRLPDVIFGLWRPGLVGWLWFAGWALFILGAWFSTLRSLRPNHPVGEHNRVLYGLLALGLFTLGDLLYFLSPPGPTQPVWMGAGALVRLPGVLLAAYMVLTPRLPEFRLVLRRSASYVITTSLALVCYALLLALIVNLLQNVPDLMPLPAGLGLALLMVLLWNPLMTRLQTAVNRRISGSAKDTAAILRQYSQSITNILDLQLLATVAVGTVSEVMDVRRGFLFQVDFEKGDNGRNFYRLRGVKGMGNTNPPPGILREVSFLAQFLRSEHRPVTQPEIDLQPAFRDLMDEERQWLSGLKVEVFVPIYTKNEWIGVLAVGPRASGAAYDEEQLNLLSMLADQTAVALENTRLVEGLMRLNNEFRRAYSALDQANRHLERLDRTKSDFISIASHELRTPLTIISGSSQMLLDEPSLQENPYYKQLLSKINTGTGRLHEIVDSMLDMAMIDTRELQLDPQPVSLPQVLDGVCNELKKAYTERKQTIEIRELASLPHIQADLEALRKVFYHLVINAIKYTPDGGKITITGCVTSPNNNRPDGSSITGSVFQPAPQAAMAIGQDTAQAAVELIITDTGIGIDPRYQDLIFAKFYQTGELALHSTGKTKFKGAGPGLGLAIVRGIVEAHGGKVWVESRGYNEETCPGSSFHIVLPVKQNMNWVRKNVAVLTKEKSPAY